MSNREIEKEIEIEKERDSKKEERGNFCLC